MHSIKYIIKRIIIGTGIALALMFIKGNLLMQVQAKSVLTNKVSSEVYTYNNTAYSFTTTMDTPFFKNAGIGYLYFTFSSYKASGTSTSPISIIRSAVVFSGDTGYVCQIGTSGLTNSTYGGVTYSARCPVNLGSSGVTKIVYSPSDLQANDISLYRFTNEGYYTFESDANVNVNVDTSSTTSAINNQTTTITNNQNQNTQDIIDNQKDLLGDRCKNIFNSSIQQGSFLPTSGVPVDSTTRVRTTDFTNVDSGTYTISISDNSNQVVIYVYNTSGTWIENESLTSWQSLPKTITFNGSRKIKLAFRNSTNTNISPSAIQNVQIEKGSISSAYCVYGTATSKLDTTNQNLSNVNQSINNVNNTLNNSDTDQAQQDSDSAFLDFDLNTHGLTRIVTAPIRLLTAMLGGTCNSLTLPLPFVNQNVVLPCMSSIYQQHFGNFLVLYRLITDGIIGYWVAVNVFRKCKDFLDPTNDKIEVFNL